MFSTATFDFLGELAANNQRDWFERNKPRYEAVVREPALDFIAAMAPHLESFAPEFRAEPRKIGGSLMRVYRDTRFSRDKIPYKTNIGIQFRHRLGKDVHAPGFYVHIANEECFLAVGCWRPEPDALSNIRNAIAEKPEQWFKACGEKAFQARWTPDGDALSRPPRDFPADHVAISDLKRKDFAALHPLSPTQVVSENFVELVARSFAETASFMRFLCKALDIPY